MKKFLGLIFLLPFISWAQVDSLKTNQSVDDALNNRIGGHFNFNSKNNDTIKIDSTHIPSSFNGTVPSRNYAKTKYLYVLNGILVNQNQVKKLKTEDIKSVTIVKSNLNLISCRNNVPVIVIVTEDKLYSPVEYDLTVLDLGYESFLTTQPSAETFSINFLKNKNQRYVSTWNQRFLANNSNIYETSIDYDSQVYYGLEFEYKLYMFFKFMEQKHRISFNG